MKRSLRWRDWPWAAKLASLLGTLAIVPLTIMTLYNAAASRAELLAAAREQNLRQAANTAGAIDGYLAGVLSDIKVVAQAPGTSRYLAGSSEAGLPGDVRLSLLQMRDTHGFDALYLTGHDGRVTLATDDRFLGRSYLSSPYVRNAMAGNAALDAPRWDSHDRRVFLHVSAPVRDGTHRIAGAAVGRLLLSDLDRIVAADTGYAGRAEFGILWDFNGIRLSHPIRPGRRFRALEPLPPDVAARLMAENRFGPDTLKRVQGGPLVPNLVERSRWLLYDPNAGPFLRIRYGDQVLHAAVTPLRETRWLYGIFSPEDAILASVEEQTRRNLLLAGLTALFAAILAFASARWLAAPLERVGRTAQALAAGDMTRRVGLRQRDEIGSLAAAFDAMAESLAAKDAELRGYADHLQQRVEEQTAALRASEEELRDLYAREQELRCQAEEANRIKDEFLSTVSHELRTPLNAILGWTWLLGSGKLDGEGLRRAVATIERNARAQSQIIDDLLDVSRIITGKLRLQVEPVDLIQVIEAALDSIGPAADAKEIRVERRLDPEAAWAKGDAQRLQQIVWNLLSNAVKFTPRGGRIEITLVRRDSQIEIRVSDTGIGIPADFLGHVFDRFRQADSSSTRAHGGLGLGLAIVRHLVELHGGTVAARSDGEGRGAAFSVRLPVPALLSAAPAPEPLVLAGDRPVSPVEASAVEGLNILLVDDEADTREVLPMVLAQFGVRVTPAATAAEALEALERSPVDLLVADIGMPEEDGYSLIGKIRASKGRNASLPAIALTAYAAETDRQRALAAGFQLHLAKPVEAHELVSALAALAGGERHHHHLETPASPRKGDHMRQRLLPILLSLIFLPSAARADERADLQRMAQEHKHDKPVATQAAKEEPARPVDAQEVTYAQIGGKPVRGYFARPKAPKGDLPGLIVIHEWWGLNDNIRAMTRRLAGEGYQALAVDFYGGAVADNPDQAMKLMNASLENRAAGEENVRRAAAWLEGKGARKLGVIGWCFGGSWSLGTTRLLPDKIDATVIYYGRLETDAQKLSMIKNPVLGIFGAGDESIPVASVRQFESVLKKQGTPVEIRIYEDAGHAFANSSGGSYRPEAARDAWQRTTAFFARHLKGGLEMKKK